MGRGMRYRSGPTDEEIVAARKAQDDLYFREALTIISVIVIFNLLLTAAIWYFYPTRLHGWDWLAFPVIMTISMIIGTKKLLRWFGGGRY